MNADIESSGMPENKGNGKQPATLDQIRAAKDVFGFVDVEVPEWGLTVKIRGLTRGEMQRAYKDSEQVDVEVLNARLMATAMIEPRMTEEEATEILDTKGMKSTKRITDAIMEASGMDAGFLAEAQG
jgi:hypothetical protein